MDGPGRASAFHLKIENCRDFDDVEPLRGAVCLFLKSYGAVRRGFYFLRKYGAVPLFQNHTVRCGALRIIITKNRMVRCGALRIIIIKNRMVRCGAVFSVE